MMLYLVKITSNKWYKPNSYAPESSHMETLTSSVVFGDEAFGRYFESTAQVMEQGPLYEEM